MLGGRARALAVWLGRGCSLDPHLRAGSPTYRRVIQTSGQFRDLAASRLALISKAVELVASLGKEDQENYVAAGSVATEKELVEQGLSPKEARELANVRIFGGVNGMYGTGIQEMVTAGDKWEQEKEIADVYLNNMGAAYTGKQEDWGRFRQAPLPCCTQEYRRRRAATSE